jgi:thiamine biosynthesis lipoprotein
MQRKHPLFFPHRKIDRRLFLKNLGIISIGIAARPVLAGPVSPIKLSKDMFMAKETKLLMGTFVTITLADPSQKKIDESMEKAFSEMKRLSALMSRYTNDSPVSELNTTGKLQDIPLEMQTVLEASRYYHFLTHGAFDITVKPLLDTYRDSFYKGKTPDKNELQKTLKSVGTQNILFGPKTIRFKKERMGITLDGIAKGYIVDRGIETLKKTGIKHALINAGGDIRALGGKKQDRPWTIGIRDPFNDKKYKTVIPLDNRSVATSGNYEIFFDQDKLFHHIIDPSSGLSPGAFSSVTVSSTTAMASDALATSVFVLGKEGINTINRIDDTEAFIIDSHNRVHQSLKWKEHS